MELNLEYEQDFTKKELAKNSEHTKSVEIQHSATKAPNSKYSNFAEQPHIILLKSLERSGDARTFVSSKFGVT